MNDVRPYSCKYQIQNLHASETYLFTIPISNHVSKIFPNFRPLLVTLKDSYE